MVHSVGQKIKKKTREIKYIQKIFFREIAFLTVLNLFPVQKWNLAKKIREIDLFDFTSLFGLDFFNFSGLL